ncbi:uroporphyrinogen-III synthase [Buchnera aphidicola (Mindarus keteleerifoliae)]|uniref:uroporphyrinogen-III synthase n=1 Tax=Buchnera aphidicola TaxID=9 RepID=UPI0031B698CF
MKILISRSSLEGKKLVQYLFQSNIYAYNFPLIDFLPLADLNFFLQKLNLLKKNDILCALSKNAVFYADKILKKKKTFWPKYINYYAIGRSTATNLSFCTKKKVLFPTKKENSNELFNLISKKKLLNKKIIIIKGYSYLNILEKKLKRTGVKISVINCYKSVPKILKQKNKYKNLKFDVIFITSLKILKVIYDFFIIKNKNFKILESIILVISKRISESAKILGWKKIFVVESTDKKEIKKKF